MAPPGEVTVIILPQAISSLGIPFYSSDEKHYKQLFSALEPLVLNKYFKEKRTNREHVFNSLKKTPHKSDSFPI